MHKRLYSKLYVNKNREEGSDKIHLGYQNDSTEYSLLKDRETYFNVPPYAAPIALKDSSFVIDGATGGNFPAVSDRIFESRKNYGNVSNNGSPSEVPEGVWFCSWLYKDPISGSLIWYDRYFDPIQLNVNLYNPETFNGMNYILNAPPSFFETSPGTTPVFEAPTFFRTSPNVPAIYDVPSTMVIEPGVLYKYFHFGEKTAQDILTTYGGVSGQHLLLDASNWQSKQAGAYPITINSAVSSSKLFLNPSGSQISLSSALGFNHNQNVEAYINWSQNYAPTANEFTLGLWCESSDWNNCPSTQLYGNYSAKGGFGIFVDTLQTYPYFLIPETTYGHLIFTNQESQGFLDKVVVSQLSSLSLHIPALVAIDSNDCSVVCSDGNSPSVYKLDHAGNLLGKANLSLSANETLVSLNCDPNDNIILTTNLAVYTFDTLLTTNQVSYNNISTQNAASAFTYSTLSGTAVLVTVPDALDVKYIQDVQWAVLSDGNVYKNGTMFLTADGGITNIHVDPNGKLWVLNGTNNVSVFDPTGSMFQAPLFTFTVGTDFVHPRKHLSFIRIYNRSTTSFKWVSVIYYSDEHYIYTNTLDGKVNDIVDMSPFINYAVARELQQNPDTFRYGGRGDFTGYELKRVSNALSPTKKLVIKMALRDKTSSEYIYKTFKAGVSIDDWNPNTWKHIIMTHKNKTVTLYLNAIKQASFQYSGRYELTFDSQPATFIGSPLGVSSGLNKELASVTSLFNGTLAEARLYDYCIDSINFDMFLRAGIAAEDMLWSLPIPSVGYIERIERMFKNKLPGNKSSFYNIKLSGTNITDPTTRALIEEQIKTIISQISPIHTDLVKVIWIG